MLYYWHRACCVLHPGDHNNRTCSVRKGASMKGEMTLVAGLHSLMLTKYPIMQMYSSTLNAANSSSTTEPQRQE